MLWRFGTLGSRSLHCDKSAAVLSVDILRVFLAMCSLNFPSPLVSCSVLRCTVGPTEVQVTGGSASGQGAECPTSPLYFLDTKYPRGKTAEMQGFGLQLLSAMTRVCDQRSGWNFPQAGSAG